MNLHLRYKCGLSCLQLKRELRKGRAFDGWSEGVLEFAPTYKYDFASGKYIDDDQRGGRRTPAWCDRVLSFGKGVRLLSYARSELALSDHMLVAATYAAEVKARWRQGRWSSCRTLDFDRHRQHTLDNAEAKLCC
jgi:hypothetical protein